ncbi:hypothetical protein LT337_25850 [Mycolicibacterium fortuitum]|nr:hypothetical protein LT337_25850 [Mycolicibacterium fortuitum]
MQGLARPGNDPLDDLATAVEEADRGGSLYEAANILAQLAGDRAELDKVMPVLSPVRPRTWLRLDTALRKVWHPSYRWRQIIGATWHRSDSVALLLTACSADGRQRQRAVDSRPMCSDQRLLPLLLIRAADWAEPVRVDAAAALPAALAAADAESLIRAAGVAMAMRDWRRGEHAVAAVTEALRTRTDGTLDAARMSDDVHVRRLGYRVWLEQAPDSMAVVEAALTERDNVCQSLCVEAVVRSAVGHRPDTLERLLGARFTRVRAEALAGLVQIGHPEAGRHSWPTCRRRYEQPPSGPRAEPAGTQPDATGSCSCRLTTQGCAGSSRGSVSAARSMTRSRSAAISGMPGRGYAPKRYVPCADWAALSGRSREC